MQLFNILYAGGNEEYKVNFVFKLIHSSQTGTVKYGSPKLLKCLEYITIISSIVMTDGILKEEEEFPDDEDEKQLDELHQLFSSNQLIT